MRLIISTDGGSRGNPGPAASGYVIKNEAGVVMYQGGTYLGVQTNNFAEYTAVIESLKKAKELGGTEILFFADSKLVIEQLKGNWRVKEPTLQKLFLEAWNLLQGFKSVKLSHVLRAKNVEADREVNLVLDKLCGKKFS